VILFLRDSAETLRVFSCGRKNKPAFDCSITQ